MRSINRIAPIVFVSALVFCGCTDERVDVPVDQDAEQVDMNETDAGGDGDDAGTDRDMGVVIVPSGPDRVVPGVSGEQRLGSEKFRLGVSVGAPGAPTLESSEYRLRLGPQPYLVRPGAESAPSE